MLRSLADSRHHVSIALGTSTSHPALEQDAVLVKPVSTWTNNCLTVHMDIDTTTSTPCASYVASLLLSVVEREVELPCSEVDVLLTCHRVVNPGCLNLIISRDGSHICSYLSSSQGCGGSCICILLDPMRSLEACSCSSSNIMQDGGNLGTLCHVESFFSEAPFDGRD